MKTIDDLEVIEKIISKRNTVHLNQAHGIPLTIESLLTLLGIDGFTPFTSSLLSGTADMSSLQLTPNIREYLKKMKNNKEKVK